MKFPIGIMVLIVFVNSVKHTESHGVGKESLNRGSLGQAPQLNGFKQNHSSSKTFSSNSLPDSDNEKKIVKDLNEEILEDTDELSYYRWGDAHPILSPPLSAHNDEHPSASLDLIKSHLENIPQPATNGIDNSSSTTENSLRTMFSNRSSDKRHENRATQAHASQQQATNPVDTTTAATSSTSSTTNSTDKLGLRYDQASDSSYVTSSQSLTNSSATSSNLVDDSKEHEVTQVDTELKTARPNQTYGFSNSRSTHPSSMQTSQDERELKKEKVPTPTTQEEKLATTSPVIVQNFSSIATAKQQSSEGTQAFFTSTLPTYESEKEVEEQKPEVQPSQKLNDSKSFGSDESKLPEIRPSRVPSGHTTIEPKHKFEIASREKKPTTLTPVEVSSTTESLGADLSVDSSTRQSRIPSSKRSNQKVHKKEEASNPRVTSAEESYESITTTNSTNNSIEGEKKNDVANLPQVTSSSEEVKLSDFYYQNSSQSMSIYMYLLSCLVAASMPLIRYILFLFDSKSLTDQDRLKSSPQSSSVLKELTGLKKKLDLNDNLHKELERANLRRRRLEQRIKLQEKLRPLKEELMKIKESLGDDVDRRISDLTSHYHSLKILKSNYGKNKELKKKMKNAKYEQLSSIQAFVKLEALQDIMNDIDFKEKYKLLEDSALEMQVKTNFLSELMDLYRDLRNRFTLEYKDLQEKIAVELENRKAYEQEKKKLRLLIDELDFDTSVEIWKRKISNKKAEAEGCYNEYRNNHARLQEQRTVEAK